MPVKGRQISVRLLPETDAWLERRAGGRSNKADFVRCLIEREMAQEREEDLLQAFNRAAADATESDRAELDALLGAFVANERPRTPPGRTKTRVKRKTSR